MNSTSNNDSKIALITGITGEDGSYLAELLLEKGFLAVSQEQNLRAKALLFIQSLHMEQLNFMLIGLQ